jgi:ribosomal protein S27E
VRVTLATLSFLLGDLAMPKKKPIEYHTAIKCLECDTVVMSLYRTVVSCNCGEISVDGGLGYIKVSAKNPNRLKSVRIKIL